ncbi:hypothetical protein [Aquimarina sp. MAR_2010_214]|nr:hypothetical protein [Aquimarina sp. MAR_2010_214]
MYLEIKALRKELIKILNATGLWDSNVNIIQVTDAKNSVLI